MRFLKIEKLSDLKTVREKVTFLAGGTDIYPLLSDGFLENEIFCDISGIENLKKISIGKKEIKIGALVTFSRIRQNSVLSHYAGALVKAAGEVGSPQIRNRATIGGNVATASPSGDSIPALFVLKARIKTNKRTIPVEDFFMGVKKTVLAKNEIITEIILPKNKMFSDFVKVGPRKALAISKVSVALAVKKKNNIAEEVLIAFGAVAPTVVRARKAEQFLTGKIFSKDNISKAAEIAKGEISPIDDFRSTGKYRRSVAGVLVARILEKAI
ncbi:MAG: xanthine dehydrogenase family protein subunit M [Elusimicrobia bacterium]|nr:xanthine dehydrogenase family protein subunit M [Elusimicrobiota bacterium]